MRMIKQIAYYPKDFPDDDILVSVQLSDKNLIFKVTENGKFDYSYPELLQSDLIAEAKDLIKHCRPIGPVNFKVACKDGRIFCIEFDLYSDRLDCRLGRFRSRFTINSDERFIVTETNIPDWFEIRHEDFIKDEFYKAVKNRC